MESQSRKLIQQACPDSSSFHRIDKLLSGTDLTRWFQQIDDSSFSLSDWIEAVLEFDAWLSRNAIAERPLDSMIGYIHCCTLTMAETLSPPNLASLTREMLDQHGFDAASDAKAAP